MQYKYSTLLVDLVEGVLTCRLNRPDARNAINLRLHEELEDFFLRVARDREVRCIILTGVGRSFSAGGDLDEMAFPEGEADHGAARIFTDDGLKIIRSLLSIPQPVIAAINGHAVGLGATLALYCDITMIATGARIGDPHVAIGLVAGDGGAVVWPLLAGTNRAKEYLFTGDLISAEDAYRFGLVNKVYEIEELHVKASEFAQRLEGMPVAALQWTKRSINKPLLDATERVIDMSLALEGLSSLTTDHKAVVQKMLDSKREAQSASGG